MRPILLDNAFEAWTSAIHFCNDIKAGKATLLYQKNFVSTLHNAVELIMKQMMLNNNDHRVAEIKKTKCKEDAKLLYDYFNSKDLNCFFDTLSDEQLSKFTTIQFKDLISLHKKILGQSIAKNETLETELKLLQRLRNNETHFLIRQGSFLSEENFLLLHNFMINFYKILKVWFPKDGEDLEQSILLWWDWFSTDKEDNTYKFECEPLKEFSYEKAVRNSKLANEIAQVLKGQYLYGGPDFSPYTIAKELVEGYTGLSAEFNEVWEMVYMMQSLGIIKTYEIRDEEIGMVYFSMKVSL